MDACIAYKDIKGVQFLSRRFYERPYTCVSCINVWNNVFLSDEHYCSLYNYYIRIIHKLDYGIRLSMGIWKGEETGAIYCKVEKTSWLSLVIDMTSYHAVLLGNMNSYLWPTNLFQAIFHTSLRCSMVFTKGI